MTITREMVLGAKVIELHQTYELSNDGLDTRIIYFTTDRDFTFTMPFADVPWHTCEVPEGAELLDDKLGSTLFSGFQRFMRRLCFIEEPSTVFDTVSQIKKRIISGVYCGAYDETLKFYYPPDGVIVFDDGSQAANNMVAPHGTGAAGLYFHASTDAQTLAGMVDFFTIPEDRQETE